MSDRLDEFVRESTENLLKQLPLPKRLVGLSPEQRLDGLSAHDVVEALSAEALEALVRQAQHQRPVPDSVESRPFSFTGALLRAAREDYRQSAKRKCLLIYEVFRAQAEDFDPNELSRQDIDRMLNERIDDVLRWLSPKERLEGLSARERLQGLSVQEVVKALSPKSLEELLQALNAGGLT